MIILEILLSFFLGGIFLLSAIPKLHSPRAFIFTVLEYRVLPFSLGWFYGWLLPPLELLLALMLLSGTSIRISSCILALLLFSFIVAIGLNIARGRDLDCGCFSPKKKRKIGWKLLLEDTILLMSTITLMCLEDKWNNLTTWSFFSLGGFSALQSLLSLLLCVGVLTLSAWFLTN